jgi:cation diffusion facilitator CzcD-associated flavoprotein CzcO
VRYDAVVVGAGPYGLSTAAHLIGRGLHIAVFGQTLELWRRHMPRGMFLRSHWWATELSDPRRRYGFARFFHESGHRPCYPIPRDLFVEYGLWFQRHAVPEVDPAYVAAIERAAGGFRLMLDDGRSVLSTAVIVATGLRGYAHRPAEFAHLPCELVTHSSDHDDFRCFQGRVVIVVGGGQSAIESAALLNEAGARVHVVARRPIAWREPDRDGARSLLERIVAPRASIAPGWRHWCLDRAPYAFFQLPQTIKDRYNGGYSSGAADWLRARIHGKVTIYERRTMKRIARANAGNGEAVCAMLSDGTSLVADHVILATGFKVDLDRLAYLDPRLRMQIRTDGRVPVLNSRFETSVPGLYFAGMTTLPAFGPLYRFVAGAPATARRIARAVHAPRFSAADARYRIFDSARAGRSEDRPLQIRL